MLSLSGRLLHRHLATVCIHFESVIIGSGWVEGEGLVGQIPVIGILAVHAAQRDVVKLAVVVVDLDPLGARHVIVVVSALHHDAHAADVRHLWRAAVRHANVKVVIRAVLTTVAVAISADLSNFCKKKKDHEMNVLSP